MTKRELLAKARIHEAAARLGDHGTATLTAAGTTVTFSAEYAKKHRAMAKSLREQAKAARR